MRAGPLSLTCCCMSYLENLKSAAVSSKDNPEEMSFLPKPKRGYFFVLSSGRRKEQGEGTVIN